MPVKCLWCDWMPKETECSLFEGQISGLIPCCLPLLEDTRDREISAFFSPLVVCRTVIAQQIKSLQWWLLWLLIIYGTAVINLQAIKL